MKAKSTVHRSKLSPLPDPPLVGQDVNFPTPLITKQEINDYLNAVHHYRIAKADYEKKRGSLMLKVLLKCDVEEPGMSAEVDIDGRLVVKDQCECCNVGNLEFYRS